MPSLADSLSNLSVQTQQITELASLNNFPSGPFVQALLYSPSVLTLIRDAQESETRLFKFIGEESGGKRVEKRDKNVVTPLKELRANRNENGERRENVGVMLKTALKLVNDYRPMPRARAHINELIEENQRQIDRIEELEQLIEQAKRAPVKPTTSKAEPAPTQTPKIQRNAEDAIKAEEAALRDLESSLTALRQEAAAKPAASSPAREPPSPIAETNEPPLSHRTPAKTPSMPHISNSLVNGTTPRRQITSTVNRFSPLTNLGTPASRKRSDRLSVFGRSSLRKYSVPRAEPMEHETFGGAIPEESGIGEGDETIRLVRPPSTAEDVGSSGPPATPKHLNVGVEATPKPSPFKTPAPVAQASASSSDKIEGVDINAPHVVHGIGRIEGVLGEMLQQGLREGVSPPSGTEPIIHHLVLLSRCDPDGPTSPSSSSVSSVGPGQIPKITNQTIMTAHLLLLILRADESGAVMNDVKDRLGNVARARGWPENMGTTIVYVAVGKRCVKIDRRGGGGGRVTFAT